MAAATHARLTPDDRLDRLRWLLALAPACAVLIVEVVQHQVFGREPAVGAVGTAVTCGLVLVISFPIARLAFGPLDRARAAAAARARELEAMDVLVRERERLSRELHDGTAQLLTYLLLRTQTVGQLVAADRKDDALLELEGLRAAADALYIDVRESISGLRTRVLDRGLAEALREYATDFGERHELEVTLDIDERQRVPPLVAFHLFRVAQEALSNVRKHAQAHQVWLELRCSPTEVTLSMSDDGRGFDSSQARCAGQETGRAQFGLATMAERAGIVGGEFHLETQAGRGTRVVVTVPLHDQP